MGLTEILETARTERLYPGLILHGAGAEARRSASVALGRTLLCAAEQAVRPCGECRHCRRVAWPEEGAEGFHPDFHVLERDLRTATSADATRAFLHDAYSSPYEARGQVFVIAEADSLTGGAADSLLKLLEEPPARSPRHFVLLAASRLDLLPTVRSRTLAVFLGPREGLDAERIETLAASFGASVEGYRDSGAAVFLLTAAQALAAAGGWDDPRARRPWETAAAAVVRYLESADLDAELRRSCLELAQSLLDGVHLRLRSVPAQRALEGLLSRHLAR